MEETLRRLLAQRAKYADRPEVRLIVEHGGANVFEFYLSDEDVRLSDANILSVADRVLEWPQGAIRVSSISATFLASHKDFEGDWVSLHDSWE